MTNIYSLADYTVTLKGANGSNIAGEIPDMTIGGAAESTGLPTSAQSPGYIGSVVVSRDNDAWTLEGDVTGGFVHNRNLSRIGRVSIQINQISDNVRKLIKILSIVEKTERVVPFTITINNAYNNKQVAVCESCLIRKVADQNFGERAQMQEWIFNAGVIEFVGE